jgi:multidrug resistance efflux pump
VARNLEQQLVQLDELLGLLDAKALRSAQEALEHQIAELNEQLETTRQALAQAHAQRKRLARARLLLDDSAKDVNGSGDPALHHKEVPEEPKDEKVSMTAPFVAERRAPDERRSNGAAAERRQVEDRRSKG